MSPEAALQAASETLLEAGFQIDLQTALLDLFQAWLPQLLRDPSGEGYLDPMAATAQTATTLPLEKAYNLMYRSTGIVVVHVVSLAKPLIGHFRVRSRAETLYEHWRTQRSLKHFKKS